MDGADSNNLFFGQATGRTGFRPYAFSEDAVQEFQVNTVGYPAEIGRAGGGAINVVTKTRHQCAPRVGVRVLPGQGHERQHASPTIGRGIKKQPYHFNQFGGTLGGPM